MAARPDAASRVENEPDGTEFRAFRLDSAINTTPSPRWGFDYDNGTWNCPMQCMKCDANTVNGRKCGRTTCYTLPYCWQHLKSRANLRIGRTRLLDPATGQRFTFKGLFACDRAADAVLPVFADGDPIVSYLGVQKSNHRLNQDYPGNQTAPYAERAYLTNRRRGHPARVINVDSACMRGVGAFANDRRNGACAGNARCATNAQLASGNREYPALIATANIFDGDEIYVAYGDQYWGGDHRPYDTTPARGYARLEYRPC